MLQSLTCLAQVRRAFRFNIFFFNLCLNLIISAFGSLLTVNFFTVAID